MSVYVYSCKGESRDELEDLFCFASIGEWSRVEESRVEERKGEERRGEERRAEVFRKQGCQVYPHNVPRFGSHEIPSKHLQ